MDFHGPLQPEVRPGAREESASPAWLDAPAMNARHSTKVYTWRLCPANIRHRIRNLFISCYPFVRIRYFSLENKTCVCETRMPWETTVKIWQKSLKSYIFTPTQGHVMSVKCGEPIDELTVQVWLLYDHPNFKYCTL